MFTRYVDITRRLTNSIEAWPGDPLVHITRVVSGNPADPSVSSVHFGTHTGTHIDYPMHLHLNRTPPGFDVLIGPCNVLEGSSLRLLLADGSPVGPRVLIKGPAPLAVEDAEALVRHGIRLVGVELPSIEEGSSLIVHRLLLGSGVAVIEGLTLEAVQEGPAFLIALPLSLQADDGAPVRAVLAYLPISPSARSS